MDPYRSGFAAVRLRKREPDGEMGQEMDGHDSTGIAIGRRRVVLGGTALHVGAAGCTDSGGAGESERADSPPSMTVVEAPVSAAAATTEESVEVRATVANEGDEEGTSHAELRVDGVIVETEAVTVPAGKTESVAFSGTFNRPGEYEVRVNDERAGTVVIELPPPEFEITSTAIDRTTLPIGGTIEVRATVANVGGQAGTFSAELRIDGVSVETRETTIDAGAEKGVTFTHAFSGPGDYEVHINETVVDSVRVAPPAEFEITSTAVDRTTVEVGESVAVRATVTNVGNLDGTTAAELERDGDVIAAREVTLAPAETTSVRFSVDFDEPGASELRVNGVPAGTVYVRACSIAVSETVTVGSRSSKTYQFDLKENAAIAIRATTRAGVDPTLTVAGPVGEALIDGQTDTAIRETVTTRAAGRHEIRLTNGAFLPWKRGTWVVEIERCTW